MVVCKTLGSYDAEPGKDNRPSDGTGLDGPTGYCRYCHRLVDLHPKKLTRTPDRDFEPFTRLGVHYTYAGGGTSQGPCIGSYEIPAPLPEEH